MGWFGGLIARQSQERTRHIYDYLVQLDLDQSTRSMKLPLEMYRLVEIRMRYWARGSCLRGARSSRWMEAELQPRWALVEQEGNAGPDVTLIDQQG